MKKTLLVICLVSIMVLGITGLALAKNTRFGPPVINDDAGTLSKGTLEWGTSVAQTWDPGFYTTTIITALTYGITDHLEAYVAPTVLGAAWGRDLHTGGDATLIRAYGNHGAVHQEFTDIWVGAKYQFLEEKGNIPAVAAKFGLKFPGKTDSKYLTTGEIDEDLTLCVTKGFGKSLGPFPKLQVDANAGYRQIGNPDNIVYADEVRYGASVMYPVFFSGFSLKEAPWKGFILVGELVGRNDKSRSTHIVVNHNILDAYLGVKQYITPLFYYKLGLGNRISDTTPDYLGYLGVVYYFNL